MAGELIPIGVRVTSRVHKFLTKRALRLGRERDEEAGRILHWAVVQLIERAQDAEIPPERTYTQRQFDDNMAALRKSYEAKLAKQREELIAELGAKRETTDGR